jgi:hypothetical protein
MPLLRLLGMGCGMKYPFTMCLWVLSLLGFVFLPHTWYGAGIMWWLGIALGRATVHENFLGEE